MELRNKYGNITPKKPQHLPHKHRPIDYGDTQQIVQPTDTSPPLNDKGIKRVQVIVGDLIYVGIEVNKKLLVALSAIGAQQESATEETTAAIRNPASTCAANIISLFSKKDTIIEVGSHIIQKLFNLRCSFFGCCCLLGTYYSQGYKEFVVGC